MGHWFSIHISFQCQPAFCDPYKLRHSCFKWLYVLFQSLPRLTGRDLDVLARSPLWSIGKIYRHGTGHGLGAYLNVHEGISQILYYHVDVSRIARVRKTNMKYIDISSTNRILNFHYQCFRHP